jgi:hypothetical protein
VTDEPTHDMCLFGPDSASKDVEMDKGSYYDDEKD